MAAVRSAIHLSPLFRFPEPPLVTPGDAVETRADLGLGTDDVTRAGRAVRVTVHSLGATPTNGGTATLVDATGRVRASIALPPLAAPLDLLPRTATVMLPLPAGVDPATLSVRIALPGDAREVTMANNGVPVPAR